MITAVLRRLRYRSSVTGRMIKPAEGTAHPDTSVAEARGRLPLLSQPAALTAGEAMHDRWKAMAVEPDTPQPPFTSDDAAWSDLFRAGYEAVRERGK